MAGINGDHTTRNSKWVKAAPEDVYQAFTDPKALAVWQAPGDMTGKVHHFDLRVGGGFEMSVFYPESDQTSRGKTEGKEDRYRAQFVELVPPRRIVEAINFETDDPSFAGEMTIEITLEGKNGGTNVTMAFKNIPSGIRPEDNEAGTELSLQKLAQYVE